ncbi:phage shock protein operon transcriptional activator [Sphingosinicella sp. LY1275]|uniref:phage shock protein operon transcriptional activator n=1 Tax=Sphingosinicella sp. LY1275 TaxID=3095379 RepID=UPI002ADEF162|nr:phage shock protein operon transcriptional activator [Sphingosinicella sp. LY1275]MEA1013349.1 phage shock protein operon transcriptional activator [Sphingosinicella sp. LY1275]
MERTTQMVGQSSSFLDAVERASRAAPLDRPVLVIGERGTGKELVAERLHHLSSRWDGPLVVMNCAALPETLIEAELFGHEAGSFTGANKTRMGRFEEADGGTLFLDELATLSSPAQDRLLRAVEYGEVTRIGASKPIRVDVRIVAATNEHLPKLVDEGRFRADLLDRLSFEVVTLPPLRHRVSDIPVLADHFARRMAMELEWERWPGFSNAATNRLLTYDWPGNVRELRNVVERAVYRWEDPANPVDVVQFDPFESPWRPLPTSPRMEVLPPLPDVAPETMPSAGQLSAFDPGSCADFRLAIAEYEKAILSAALEKCRWNQRAAASALQLSYDQLRHALKRHQLMA